MTLVQLEPTHLQAYVPSTYEYNMHGSRSVESNLVRGVRAQKLSANGLDRFVNGVIISQLPGCTVSPVGCSDRIL